MVVERSHLARSTAIGLFVTSLVGMAWAAPALCQSEGQVDSFAPCLEEIERAPEASDSYICFYRVAREHGSWDEGVSLLERLERQEQGKRRLPWLVLARGHLYLTRDRARAAQIYLESAEGFAEQAHVRGEVLARYNRRNALYRLGRLDEAGAEVELALRSARAGSDADALARALILDGKHRMETGGDLGAAYRSLEQAREAVFPDGDPRLKTSCLLELGNLSFRLGRYEEAIAAYEQYRDIAASSDSILNEALIAYNIVNARYRLFLEHPGLGGQAELERELEQALQIALETGSVSNQSRVHRLLGDLLREPEDFERSAGHLNRCLELAEQQGDGELEISCLLSLAEKLMVRDEERAQALSARAVSLAAELGSPRYLTYAWQARARVAFQTLERRAALAEALEALDAIESLRQLQRDEMSSIDMFSSWSRDYYKLAGELANSRPPDLDTSFEVLERMRARSLLDRVDGRMPATSVSSAASSSRESPGEGPSGVPAKIVEVQRRILVGHLSDVEREELLVELERLERERSALEVSRPRSLGGTLETIDLRSVREALSSDEALLSFQVAPDEDLDWEFAGGSWVTVISRKEVSVHRLPPRVDLERSVSLYLDLIERRDDSSDPAGVALYARLLEPALARLPAKEIRRLILVPDGVLHLLPFAALRTTPGAPPLGVKRQLVVTPSATLWHRFRTDSGPPRSGALVLADPDLGSGAGDRSTDRTVRSLAADGSELGRLPYARREGRRVARKLGSGAEVWLDGDASEAALKSTPKRFGILHFAAHAIADEQFPDRSSVVLADGDENEDGLLQVREAAGLPLEGGLVVLSACRGAGGRVVRGEGTLSLARGFFEAGAPTVVASRWLVRDREASFLFSAFYEGLTAGQSAAESLRSARARAYRAGLPTAAWAAPIVLGQGNWTLEAHKEPFYAARWLRTALVLLLAGCLATVTLWVAKQGS